MNNNMTEAMFKCIPIHVTLSGYTLKTFNVQLIITDRSQLIPGQAALNISVLIKILQFQKSMFVACSELHWVAIKTKVIILLCEI